MGGSRRRQVGGGYGRRHYGAASSLYLAACIALPAPSPQHTSHWTLMGAQNWASIPPAASGVPADATSKDRQVEDDNAAALFAIYQRLIRVSGRDVPLCAVPVRCGVPVCGAVFQTAACLPVHAMRLC